MNCFPAEIRLKEGIIISWIINTQIMLHCVHISPSVVSLLGRYQYLSHSSFIDWFDLCLWGVIRPIFRFGKKGIPHCQETGDRLIGIRSSLFVTRYRMAIKTQLPTINEH